MECLLAGEAFSEAVVEVARPGEDKHWMHQLRSLVLTDPKELPDCLESRPIEVLAATRRSVVLRSRRYFCMSDLFLLSETQLRRIQPYFALSHGIPRVDDRRVLSGIIFVIRNGLRWRDAPGDYGPSKTLCNRFIRWSRLGIFNRIFEALAHEGGKPDRVMIDATHLKAHRTAASLLKKGCSPPYRAHQRRLERKVACRVRRPRPANRAAAFRRPGERLQGSRSHGGCLAAGQATNRRSWLRRRLVSRSSSSKEHRALYPWTQEPQGGACLRRQALPSAPSH